MRHTIYIEPEEEITNIIDKIRKSPEKEVAIVAPKGSVLLQSLVNLRILQKESQKVKLKLDIITADSVGRNLALQAGLPVYKSLKDTKPEINDVPKPEENEILATDSDSESTEDLPINYYKRENTDSADDKETDFASKEIEREDKKPTDTEEEKNEEQVSEKNKNILNDESEEATEADEIKEKSGFIARSANEIHKHDNFDEESKSVKDEEEDESSPIIKPQFNEKNYSDSTSQPSGTFRKISAEKAKKRAITIGIAIFFIMAVIGAGLALVPRAIVTIAVKAEDYNKKITVSVYSDKSNVVDSKDSYLIGKTITAEAEVKDDYQATGKKDVGTKAAGEIIAYNEWDTLMHSFPAGTKFTSSGKIFLAKSAFTIPGATLSMGAINAGKTTVSVEAQQPGEAYNLSTSKFSIDGSPNQAKIYGQSNTAFTGGTTKQLTIVSQDDADKAKESETAKLRSAIIDKLKSDNKDVVIIEKAIQVEVSNSEISDNIGTEAEKFSYKLTGKGTVIVFAKNDILDKAKEIAKQDLDSGKTIMVDENTDLAMDLASNGTSDTMIPVEIDFKGKIIPVFDKNSIINSLIFKSDSDTKNIVKEKVTNIEEVKIDRMPNFWKKNPLLKNNISIKLEYR